MKNNVKSNKTPLQLNHKSQYMYSSDIAFADNFLQLELTG